MRPWILTHWVSFLPCSADGVLRGFLLCFIFLSPGAVDVTGVVSEFITQRRRGRPGRSWATRPPLSRDTSVAGWSGAALTSFTERYSTLQGSSVPYNALQHRVLWLSVMCSSVPCSAVQHCSMQGNAALFHAVQCSTVPCSAVQHCSMQCSAALFYAVQCSTVPCSAVQHCSMQGNAALFHTMQCSTVP